MVRHGLPAAGPPDPGSGLLPGALESARAGARLHPTPEPAQEEGRGRRVRRGRLLANSSPFMGRCRRSRRRGGAGGARLGPLLRQRFLVAVRLLGSWTGRGWGGGGGGGGVGWG